MAGAGHRGWSIFLSCRWLWVVEMGTPKKKGREEMSLPLIVRSKLFWINPSGQIDCCWYLSYAPTAKQDAYIRDMDKFGIDTITLNLCNEEIATPFSGEFMASSIDEGKVNRLAGFIARLKNAGKNVILV